MSKGQDRADKMVDALRTWQGIERKAMEQTAQIMEKTDNSYLRIIMEIIRHDSLMHHRVQQTLIDSLTRENITLSVEDISEVWEAIEEHDQTEKDVVKIAKELRDQAWTPIHKELLDYLVTDEEKHDKILMQLEAIKKGISRTTS